ncbi:MAG: FG-GAP repeat domain-containing protein, partial [Candidatus Thorarchaeota archaeon]
MRVKFLLGIVILSIFIVNRSLAETTFTEITAQAGINNTSKGTCAAFADYDGDGYVDIYVGNNGKLPEPMGKPNILYHNNGDGTFTNVADATGVADARQTQGIAFGD